MKQVYFATKNKGKVSSFKRVLSQYGIDVIHLSMDLLEPRTDDLQDIARQKVFAAYREVRKPVVALDAGFYIFSLNDFPGAFVNHALKTIGIEGILKLTEGKSRECKFRECLAYFDEMLKEPLIFESEVRGTVSEHSCGKVKDFSWSELVSIFIPQGESRTLAEMSLKEYRKWSGQRHQDSYASEFAEWYSGRNK